MAKNIFSTDDLAEIHGFPSSSGEKAPAKEAKPEPPAKAPARENGQGSSSARASSPTAPRRSRRASSRTREREQTDTELVEKVRVSYTHLKETEEALKNAVIHLRQKYPATTVTSYVERAIREQIARDQDEFNSGRPFPRRQQELPTGRPLKVA